MLHYFLENSKHFYSQRMNHPGWYNEIIKYEINISSFLYSPFKVVEKL